jgi:hypothetical protein
MENNEAMVQEQAKEIVSAPQNELAPTSVWTDQAQFNQLARAAKMLSETNIIPQNYQGKPQDCFVAIEMATRMNISPLVVMQNMYVVKGKPSWAGQACTMLINSCGKFKDVKHIYTGKKGTDERGCYVSAVRISDGVELNGVEVTINMAKAEGWTSNPKWRNMPELMLAYRASAFFARVYCPEALMGVQTYEEVIDTDPTQEKNKAIDLTEELKGE